jgi:hypothetical protein
LKGLLPTAKYSCNRSKGNMLSGFWRYPETFESLVGLVISMMKKIGILLLIALNIMSVGCTWPGILSADGNLYISKPTGEEINPVTDRTVILTFWRFPGVNNSPPQIVFDEATIMKSVEEKISFSWKFYQIVWTPVFGTQHLSPDPAIVAFSEGNWPLIGYDVAPINYKLRPCCQAPHKHIREFRLKMIPVTNPLSLDTYTKKDYELLIKDSIQLQKFIHGNRNLTSEDKRMIQDSLNNIERIL